MDRNNPGPNHPHHLPKILVSAPEDSEEEIDREIIESLTRAHPTNAEVNVDEMIALQQQEIANENLQPAPMAASTSQAESPKPAPMAASTSQAKSPKPAPMAASTSQAKSPKRPKRDLLTGDDMADVVQKIALSEMQESRNENLQPAPMAASTSQVKSPKPAPMAASTSQAKSPKRPKQDLLTDDDMADMEVNRITSSFESRNRPGTSSVLQKPIATYSSSIPRRCQRNKENPIVPPPVSNDPFDIRNIPIFPPLRELNFEFDADALMNSSTDGLPTNGLEKRRSSGSGRDSVPSVYSNGSSPDERQICVFRLTDGSRIRSAEIRKSEVLTNFVKKIETDNAAAAAKAAAEVMGAAAAKAENADNPVASTSGNSKKSSAKEKKNKKKQ